MSNRPNVSQDNIPVMPDIAKQIFALLQEKQIDSSDAVGLIESDPTARQFTLRMANTLQPNSSGGASLLSVIEAYSSHACLEWAMAGALQPMLMFDRDDELLSELYLHSLATAFCAVLLERESKRQPQRYLFLSGLLHDIGLAVLVRNFGVDFSSTVDLALEETISIDEAERKRLGCDHGDVGADSVCLWSGIQPVIDVVKYHHRPDDYEGPNQHLLDFIHIADGLSRMVGIGISNEGLSFHSSIEAEKRIGYSPEIEETVVYSLLAGMEILQTDIV